MTQQARFRLPPELDELTKPEMLRLISEANPRDSESYRK